PASVFSHDLSGPLRSSLQRRAHLLEVNGFVAERQLQLTWAYSENLHRRTTVEALAQQYIEALDAIIAHCQSPNVGGYTPSDFHKAGLNQKDLDKLLSRLTKS